MNHPGYFLDSFNRQTVYRCAGCKYDSFVESNIRTHVSRSHPPIELPDTQDLLSSWIGRQNAPISGENRVFIGFLTWNTDRASELAAYQIAQERLRLAALGVQSIAMWVDNHSEDATVELVSQITGGFPTHLYSQNMGQSFARNRMLDEAMGWGATHIMFVDGDIEIVPYSSYAMMNYLNTSPNVIGCVGLTSSNCTSQPDSHVATECRRIDHDMTFGEPLIAWTQYGMFRPEMFRAGLRFDEKGFGGPGWGLEDDDFYFQMHSAGYESRNTPYFRYLHRPRNSSLRNLGQSLATKLFDQRRTYILSKWRYSGDGVIQSRLRAIKGMKLSKPMFDPVI